ncbi:MAG: AAA family ATPase [Pseudomonadota bacterium]|nr:MAG: AAA family ATPase [Pseudomonadota bacterium]
MTPGDAALIDALRNPALYDDSPACVTVVETHISWVLLTGNYAYKIKKPLDLGFLDFSTLELRHRYCEQELRLNRRLAPELYLEVVSITGSVTAPRVGGAGTPIEYAVKMREFPQSAQLDRVLQRDELTGEHIDQLAIQIAAFHQRIDSAGPDSLQGTANNVREPVDENFAQIESRLKDTTDRAELNCLRVWSEAEFDRQRATFEARKAAGFVRECHGDMHLANMALIDEQVLIFDCIEFNENLRWNDVMSEVAFLVMDLDDRAHPELASRFLNDYLEITGDYAGLAVLRYYLVYRALVRAKVDCIRACQPDVDAEQRHKILDDYRGYIRLALRYTYPGPPLLMITCGLSGSGKSTVARQVGEHCHAIRLRSDVERKRLYGLAAEARSDSGIRAGIYSADATRRTYQHLETLAGQLIGDGYSVVVDAAFLDRAWRARFIELARRTGIPFLILECHADEQTLRARVALRERAARDASEAGVAVLEHQLASAAPFDEGEQRHALRVDTTRPVEGGALARQVAAWRARQG